MAPELRESILEILEENGQMEPVDIRDELDADEDPSKQLVHYHLKQALDAGEVEKPHTGVYELASPTPAGDSDE
jgi:predicted transcriptional regulator